jgi:hypothetical protein
MADRHPAGVESDTDLNRSPVAEQPKLQSPKPFTRGGRGFAAAVVDGVAWWFGVRWWVELLFFAIVAAVTTAATTKLIELSRDEPATPPPTSPMPPRSSPRR